MKRDKQTNTLIYNKRLNLNDSLHDKQVWGGGVKLITGLT